MHSIRTKFALTVVSVIIITLSIATAIGVISIKNLGRDDADQMLHLTAKTGAMNLEHYFESVEHSVRTVSTLVSDSFDGMSFEDLDSQVERARNLFGRIAYNTNGVLTYYFRIDPEISEKVTGFWYVYQDGEGFTEHEVTDITQYDTSDTSALVWFTVPKATGKGVWLPPYYTENLGARVISYNEPVYWKDRFVGVIGIEIDYEMLRQEVENISIFNNNFDILEAAINGAAMSGELAQIAFSGRYEDLVNAPDVSLYITEDEAQFMVGATLGGIFTYKDTVADVSALPANPTAGDVYYATDPGKYVAWNGSAWKDIEIPVDLEDYLTDDDIISITTSEIEALFPVST